MADDCRVPPDRQEWDKLLKDTPSGSAAATAIPTVTGGVAARCGQTGTYILDPSTSQFGVCMPISTPHLFSSRQRAKSQLQCLNN